MMGETPNLKIYHSPVENGFYGEDVQTGMWFEIGFSETDKIPVDLKHIGTIVIERDRVFIVGED